MPMIIDFDILTFVWRDLRPQLIVGIIIICISLQSTISTFLGLKLFSNYLIGTLVQVLVACRVTI
jgi:hypothetical protein